MQQKMSSAKKTGSSWRAIGVRLLHILERGLALLWGIIGWLWGVVVIGMLFGGSLGNAAYSYITKGQFDPIDFAHLPIIVWMQQHIWLTILLFLSLAGISLLAFLAHRRIQRQKQVALELVPLQGVHTLQPAKTLDPRNFKLVHYVRNAYIRRPADEQAQQIVQRLAAGTSAALDDSLYGICIVGLPAQGKTRLAWEVMQSQIPNWLLFRWVHEQSAPPDLTAYRGKNIILWLDDLHEYANPTEAAVLSDLPRRFMEAGCKIIIIATCRDGENYTQTQKYLERLLEHLECISLGNIDTQEVAALTKLLVLEGREKDIHTDEFNGTPGSLILGLKRMHNRYKDLPSPSQTLLKTMKLLYAARIYSYPEKRLIAVARDLFGFQPLVWREAAHNLVQAGFVRLIVSPQSERALEQAVDSYLEDKIIQDYPTTGTSLYADWPELKTSLVKELDAPALLSLGNAFLLYITKYPRSKITYAAECYRTALQVYTRVEAPLQWAVTQNNLGIALTELAGSAEGKERERYLRESRAAYRAALKIRTRNEAPLRWAMTQNNLGIALTELAGSAEGKKRERYLRESRAVYHAALEVRTRQEAPLDWAETRNNLGLALRDLAHSAEGSVKEQLLREAIRAHQDASQVYTPSYLPSRWASTQFYIAFAYMMLAEMLGHYKDLQTHLHLASQHVGQALTVFTEHEYPEKYALLQDFIEEIEQALLKLDQLPPDKASDAIDGDVSDDTSLNINDKPEADE